MTCAVSPQLLSELGELIAGETGLNIPPENQAVLERALRSAAPALGCPDVESCARLLLSAPLSRRAVEALACELTVGETYFFREKQSFEILAERIIPEIARLRRGSERRLRIWSAGCCTGEEPYSIAIALDRILPDLPQWQVTILATDVNARFLRKAAEGVYNDWSFRDAPAWLKIDYFTQTGPNRFEIAERIKERVSFSYLNLADDTYPSFSTGTYEMDLIFCRNVLMYFTAEGTRKVVRRFHRSLADGGWLLVSPVEASAELFARYSSVSFRHAIFYRKEDGRFPTAPCAVQPDFEVATWAPRPEVEIPSAIIHEDVVFAPNPEMTMEAKGEEASPTPAEAPEDAARRRADLGDLSGARSLTDQAIDADKLNAGLHYLSAVILQEQGAAEEVAAALKRALYLDPNFVLAHFALGNLALRRKNSKEAGRHFANVLDLLAAYEPNDALPLSDGLAAGRLRELVESAMAAEKAA